VIPGWHTTIFPPYFVAGAIYSGFAMVLTIMIPVREWFKMHDFITDRHLDNMAKVMLATGLAVCYGYFCEAFFAWYSGSEYERFMMWNRMFGPAGWAYGALLFCNLTPQFAVDQVVPHHARPALHHLHHCEHRHVARTLRHRRHSAAPRLPAAGVGRLRRHHLRLDGLHRNVGTLPHHDVPVHPVPADDHNLRAPPPAGAIEQGRNPLTERR
jgi:hypothetical protein